jgi:hypothetical protein
MSEPYTWVPDETEQFPEWTWLPPVPEASHKPTPPAPMDTPTDYPVKYTLETIERICDLSKPPLPPVIPLPPLYVMHFPYPEPPIWHWNEQEQCWEIRREPPIEGLTPARSDSLNKNTREPLSLEGDDPEWDQTVTIATPCELEDANILTSAAVGRPGIHKLAIDIDLSARLVPSTTPGHWHLYVDVDIEWNAYRELLLALAKAGVIEKGYARASIKRGYTSLRPPWVMKTPNEMGDSH